jgi:hypothetical protein
MERTIVLSRQSGASGGFRHDLPLEREGIAAVTVDARELRSCHPMFVLRLRLFIDWHLTVGHDVRVIAPLDRQTAQSLADLGLKDGLAGGTAPLPAPREARLASILPLRRFEDFNAVEDTARETVELLERQSEAAGVWGYAMFAAVSELCNNAIQHGRNILGGYVVADYVMQPQGKLRVAIADLGIGIPEHIRSQFPEWHDDTAAIGRATERGVSGTGDPQRGNGFAEVFDEALRTDLIRNRTAAEVDIRSGRGRLTVELVGGVTKITPHRVGRPRRGAWMTYTLTTA